MRVEQRLAGSVAVVTGAGRGIGAGISQALAREGAHVVLVARTESEISAGADAIRAEGGSASALAGDVAEEGAVARIGATVLERYGNVDILVNNAGIGIFKPVREMRVEEFDAMWRVNMRGVFLMTKAFLPTMEAHEKGTIVNIASLAGKNSMKSGAGYCATKWALRGFAGSLMLEAREKNVRVVTICPGSVETGFSAAGKKGENIPRPEDVADAVVFAVTAHGRALFSEIDLRPTHP